MALNYEVVSDFNKDIHIAYARRVQAYEETVRQYHLEEASSVTKRIVIDDQYPRQSSLDLLFGVTRSYAPWAIFKRPVSKDERRPFLSFARVAPSLGSQEKQSEDTQKLHNIPCKTTEEEKEKKALLACFAKLFQLNEMKGYIIGHIGQFLQG